jgi:gamma-butyrobetaine dioxygenase
VNWQGGHESEYTLNYLQRWAGAGGSELKAWRKDAPPQSWDGPTIANDEHLFVDYASLDTKQGIYAAREQLLARGLVLVRGVPTEHTDDAKCELRTLASKFGEIRKTFYGETWDVRAVPRSENVAYTSLHLGLHMDLLLRLFMPSFATTYI